MPKRVDHQARRAQIADALIRVAAEHGLEAVSLRHVAAEAGVSAGMVQHYFRSKDQMMDFALRAVSDRAEARLAALGAELGPDPAPRELLRTLLTQLLPLDEARHAEGRVALAFLAYAATRPAVAARLRADNAQMRAFVADQVRTAQAAGGARPDADPDLAAMTLLALVEGLGVLLISQHDSPDGAVAALDSHLGALFTTA